MSFRIGGSEHSETLNHKFVIAYKTGDLEGAKGYLAARASMHPECLGLVARYSPNLDPRE
jgi:hypothetical protein